MERDRLYPEKFRGQIESCYSCGQCESYCPFFPKAFGILEEEEQYGRTGLLEKASEELIVLCYDCKLCKSACPFKYDLPRIMISAKAYLMRSGRPSWIKTIFQRVDQVEFALGWFAPAVNLLFSNRAFRSLLQRISGIHRKRLLPSFCFLTFRSRSFLQPLIGPFTQKIDMGASNRPLRRVLYFCGCYTNYHRPQEGMAALKVLQACGIDVVTSFQRCCGLPQLSEGFPDDARGNMASNLKVWRRYVEAGYDIVVTSSPCSLMIKQDYPGWTGPDADFLTGHVYEVTEYVLMLHEKGEIKLPFMPLNQRLAYHVSCHLKAQGMGMPSLELLRLIPALKVEVIDRGCCGLAGPMGYTEATYELSMTIGTPMLQGIREGLPHLAASDCPKCNMQIRQGTGLEAVHPIEILAAQLTDRIPSKIKFKCRPETCAEPDSA
ncbi:MAG: anaerobic glycerol-3-phosphate dehydrogenase subunit C [Nitrospirae bacterium]|nr:anaerobic glycerol-3-phosphate dehydrogenase subunit C [Nitrospirota bacterium]